MIHINSRQKRILSSLAVYLGVFAVLLMVASHRLGVKAELAENTREVFVPSKEDTQPFFSLSTQRTYGTDEAGRLWLSYRSIESLDFRVYRINEPTRFFSQLNNPHQMGEEENEQMTTKLANSSSVLERIRGVKAWAYAHIKDYVRSQLQTDTRKSFNQKFRAIEASRRQPLNVADFARVPLLNSSQLVTSWREPLPDLDGQYDQRMIPLEKREPGVYLVEAVSKDLRAYTVVVVTNLALIEKTSRSGELMVFTVDRRTGESRPNAQIEVVRNKKIVASGTTDASGMLRSHLVEPADSAADDADTETLDNNGFVVLAKDRNEFAISNLESYYLSDYGDEGGEGNLRGYVYTDRPIYRPGHTVFFKGILRSVDEQGGYHNPKRSSINVTIKDANDAKLFDDEVSLTSRGTFSGELVLSEEAPLGRYEIEVASDDGNSTGSFQVAEYKKPEFKVSVTGAKKYVPAGSSTKFSIDARYFFGSPLVGADVKYYIYRSRYYPWFGDDSETDADDPQDQDSYSQYNSYGSDLLVDSEGKLDASGRLDVDFAVPETSGETGDYQYKLEAQITDSSRRTIDGSASIVATRGNVIARAIPDHYVYTKGQTARVEIDTTDYQGQPVSANVILKFVERTWKKIDKPENESNPGQELIERELSSTEVRTNAQGRGSYDYPCMNQGNITIKTILNENGKEEVSIGGYVWVTSADSQWTDTSYYAENYEAIKLVPDKKSYRPGETAHVLAILPEENVNLLVTTELTTVLTSNQVKVPGKSVLLDIPIESRYAPNVYLNVTFVKKGELYTSDQRLTVPPSDKILKLEILSNKKEYKPRETASYTILARDENGAPVQNAEVSLGVVDEAIYSVAPDSAGNIRQEFYGIRYNEVETHLSVAYSFTGYAGDRSIEIASAKPGYQLADFKNESDLVQPAVRKLFKDTAYWQPTALTGSDGRATVKFQLPDNLTTWRATARGVTANTMVGVARSKVLSRKDVILRLETPRFITQGDTVTLSGIVHNYLKQAKSTQISISVSGAQLVGDSKEVVTINQQGEHRVDWKLVAPQTGSIKLLAKALTNTESDAVELSLDVVPRGVRQTKSETRNAFEDNAEQHFSLTVPDGSDVSSRKIRIDLAPSVTGTLFGALDYLTSYPYGCTEQTMSSFLPNIIVGNALKDVTSASIRNTDNLTKKSERGRDRLYAFQHEDGGWGWWKNDHTDPFMTAYVVDGLSLASKVGLKIDEERLQRGREKLLSMAQAGKTETGAEIDSETKSFMLFALAENDVNVTSLVNQLFAERNKLQPYGRALLALTLKSGKQDQRAAEVAAEIERSAISDQQTAHWESRRKAMLDFVEDNDIEATAWSLKALARVKPSSPLMPLTARWLVSNRSNSYYWSATKDTAFAIFGLIDYVKVSAELEANYDLEVYLNGETVLVQHVSNANSSSAFQIIKKGSDVSSSNDIRVVKRGKGNLYLSSSVEYYSDERESQAAPQGALRVTREYKRLSVEPDGYKFKWVVSPLTGEIHSGDLFVVTLKLDGNKGRHLMLEDPIPAGAEQLESMGNLNLDYTDGQWTDWYSAREFRDRRTVFFLDSFDGHATFQYAIRVQIPGSFVAAPARAELMYQPEITAHTGEQRFEFLDRTDKH